MGWGDELMITGQARVAQRADPRKVRVVYEKPRAFHEAWLHNPRIAQPGERGDFQELRPRQDYLRPYIAAKTERQWTWQPCSEELRRGELYFSPEELSFGARLRGLVILEPNIKSGASPNKDWGRERWRQLAALLLRHGIGFTQLGINRSVMLPGGRWVRTATARHAAAVIARARAVIVPEGALHHIAAAVGTPAVVIYGGYIAPAVTGYSGQTAFFTGEGLGCGMRVSCGHCQRCMEAIEPAAVLEALLENLNLTARHAEEKQWVK